MAGERGQASLEYLGVVALVAVVLGVLAIVPVLGGEAIAGAVARGIHRALCVVRGGECDLDARPCIVAARGVQDDGVVDLALFTIGSRELVLREERSDGTVAITFARERRGGAQLGTGRGGHVRVGRRGVRMGFEANAAVLGLLSSATTWELRDRNAADRLVDRLVVDGPRDLGRRILDGGDATGGDAPPAAATTSTRGVRVSLEARGSSRPVSAQLALSSEDVAGATVERTSGRRTFLVRRRNELAVALGANGREVVQGRNAREELYTVTVDRAGRPVDLGILRGGELAGSVDLPRLLQPVAGMLDVSTNGTRRWEAEEHLDLTEPAGLAAARDFLEQATRPRPHLGRAVAVSGALRRVLDERGVLDARVYAVGEDSSGFGAGVAGTAGRVGVDFERSERHARLVRALQRGPDGLWRQRGDCV